MSYIEHKKLNPSDSDNYFDTSVHNERDNNYPSTQCRPCIVCPPCDYREKYESSEAESSCPDFSKLCEDNPKLCCERKKQHKKNKSSSDEESNEFKLYKYGKFSECNKCDRGCGSCNDCKSCQCKRCDDHSRSSVVNSLGNKSGECPNFDDIAYDQKKKCRDLITPCKKDHEKDSCQKKEISTQSGKGKKFIISFKSKKGHPWSEYNKDNLSVHINGKNGPIIHLYRGCTYFFCVEQCGDENRDPEHAFVLTNSPAGGCDSRIIPEGFAPISKGCVCFKVTKYTPRYFFYQDSKNEFAGGLVIIHDE
jgi:hypothetical protein